MNYSIVLDKRALNDIQQAIDYYDNESAGLGTKFENLLNQHFDKLKTNPFFQTRYDNVRCLPFKKFPYMIHYTLNESDKLIIVRAVFSTYRDPKIWKERK